MNWFSTIKTASLRQNWGGLRNKVDIRRLSSEPEGLEDFICREGLVLDSSFLSTKVVTPFLARGFQVKTRSKNKRKKNKNKNSKWRYQARIEKGVIVPVCIISFSPFTLYSFVFEFILFYLFSLALGFHLSKREISTIQKRSVDANFNIWKV